MRRLGGFLALVLVAAASPARATPGIPHAEGPDIEPVTPPDAVVTVFNDERFECTGSAHTRTIAVPDGDWERIIVQFSSRHDGDPWDRLFGIAIGDVEVLRGTTPRTTFTVRRDITEYASLLPPDGAADVSLLLSTFVGALLGSVSIEFYADEPTAALVRPAADAAVGAFRWRSLTGFQSTVEVPLSFPEDAPSLATVELTMSGHGLEEFWFQNGPLARRFFHVFVDNVEVATVTVMPYTYAFLGFGQGDPLQTCVGPRTGATGDLLHPIMWWTAQQALNKAGVHTGVGEIPPRRALVSPLDLALLSGARTVKVVQEGGMASWETSLSFLLEA